MQEIQIFEILIATIAIYYICSALVNQLSDPIIAIMLG